MVLRPPLRLLVSVEYIWFLRSKPRQHFIQFGFHRTVSEYQHMLGVETLSAQEIV